MTEKDCQFGRIVRKYERANTVTASFNTIMGQMK